MPAGIPTATLAALVALSLFAGVGITAVGPGGIFVTIALVALTDL
ncbi:sulfite exporter TauE/SafE family protein, partial [Halobacterium sp. CBA1126]|nr:sulfite exporter TauE/SafE family protein [Halobacterium sp. CBA1126]